TGFATFNHKIPSKESYVGSSASLSSRIVNLSVVSRLWAAFTPVFEGSGGACRRVAEQDDARAEDRLHRWRERHVYSCGSQRRSAYLQDVRWSDWIEK